MSNETMEFDVVIVGAGPAGLAHAIRLKQLSPTIEVCVIDKGADIGAHILSGAVLDPYSLTELIPDWREKYTAPFTPVTEDKFLLLTEKKCFRLPTPPQMQNHGNYIISLGQLCRFLAEQAEQLGVNVFPGFAATEILLKENTVIGIKTGDKGVDRQGNPTARFQPGIQLLARQTVLAEGCRGSLTQQLFKIFNLRANCDPQTYGIGIKELWEIPETQHQSGLVAHSIGWPLDAKTYGGSFLYHFAKNLISIGFVIGLDYTNPYLNPYEEFQRFKTHPSVYPLLASGKRIAYGARTLTEGGLQSIPKLCFPGGVIIGCAAGFMNVPRIKGIHNAIKSGMIAAESIFPQLKTNAPFTCENYEKNIQQSKIYQELHKVRNIRPAMRLGLYPGLLYAALDTYIMRGKAPWTFKNHADHLQITPADQAKKITYPKHDNQVTFDLLTSLYLANVQYEENQPYHLKLADRSIAIEINFKKYASPEIRYCPAAVYEIVYRDDIPRLQINGGNCIHCKACDIKDPTQNITWTPSEGGSGPQYTVM